MVGWIILGVIVLIITAIMLIPVGADLGYEDGRLHVSAKLAGVLLQIFPRPPKDETKPPREKKPKKEKKPKEPKPEEEEKPKKGLNLNFTLDEILELIRAVLKGLGKFGRGLKVDRFVFHFVAAGHDPYHVAMSYGYVNAALSSLAPLCKKLTVKNSDVWTEVDFIRDWPHVDFAVAMTIRIGQIVGVGFTVAFGALKILLRNKRRLRKEAREAAKHPQEESNITDINEIKEQTTQEEERMDANG